MSVSREVRAARRDAVAECLADDPFATLRKIQAFIRNRGFEAGFSTISDDRKKAFEKVGDELMADTNVFKRIIARLEKGYIEAYEQKQFQAMALCIREMKSLLKLDDVVASTVDATLEKIALIDKHFKSLLEGKG